MNDTPNVLADKLAVIAEDLRVPNANLLPTSMQHVFMGSQAATARMLQSKEQGDATERCKMGLLRLLVTGNSPVSIQRGEGVMVNIIQGVRTVCKLPLCELCALTFFMFLLFMSLGEQNGNGRFPKFEMRVIF